MTARGYKKYMKKEAQKGHPLLKVFVISFFGMLLISTFIINSMSKKLTVDTTIGDYKEQSAEELEDKKIVDNRLELIQNEDQGRNFEDKMKNATDVENKDKDKNIVETVPVVQTEDKKAGKEVQPSQDTVYKVFIGSYTSSEQAKVAKEIIQESGSGLNPIVKCIDSNNYTLQVGIFKNKQSAEAMLTTIQKNNLPGRIVQEN